MTLGEFKAWLEGYLEGGGKDIEVVRERLQLVHEMAPLVPTLPTPHWPNEPYRFPYGEVIYCAGPARDTWVS